LGYGLSCTPFLLRMKKTGVESWRQQISSCQMTCISHCLTITKRSKRIELAITANDAGHAQAQASDIARALHGESFQLDYKEIEEVPLATLFRRLAFSEFSHNECDEWIGKFVNGSPTVYTLGQRYYVRPLILDYLEINKDGCVKPSCGNRLCINPYHNSYKKMKASKLSDADTNLVLAFSGQGVPAKEIAKALKVHRSTIYRTLNREHFHLRSKDH